MFSNNWQNYGSSYTEDSINELLLACLTSGKSSDENEKFSRSCPIKQHSFSKLQPREILLFCSWKVFNYFVLQILRISS